MSRRRPAELTLAALVLAVLGVIAIANGARLRAEALVLVGAFAGAAMMVDVMWSHRLPGQVVRADLPREATVGECVPVRVRVEGGAHRFELRLADPPGEWRRVDSSGEGTMSVVAARRGVVRELHFEYRWTGPIGTCIRRRIVTLPLDRPLEIGPRVVGQVFEERLRRAPVGLSAGWAAPALGDSVRAVRPYTPGDPARLVHWPSSARSGSLTVREFDPPRIPGVAIVVELSGDDREAAEEVASRAAGLAGAALVAGAAVVLVTREVSGPAVGPVASAREVSRRLARAVGGDPGGAPDGWPVERVGPW